VEWLKVKALSSSLSNERHKKKDTLIAKVLLSKNNNTGGCYITIFNFKLYYRTIAIKTAWY
jgi:hypothetical protein